MKEIMKNEPKGYGTHAKMSKNPAAADESGERRGRIVNEVAMGKEDGLGKNHQYNTGRTEGVCYTHDRSHYR